MKTYVISSTRVAGFHQWLGAPAPVEYLGQKHRHQFHIKAFFPVAHDNRDVEFHIAKTWLDAALFDLFPRDELGFQFGGRSCEMIAMELHGYLERHHTAPATIEVWEDDEHGARVEF